MKNFKYEHLIALAVFIILSIAYFKPVVFDNKTFAPNDIVQSKSITKETVDFRDKNGEEALWNGRIFSGMPIYMVNVKFDGDLIQYVFKIFEVFPSPISVILMNFIPFYILLVSLRIDPKLAILGSIIFSFSTFTMLSIEAGHFYKVRAMGFAPLVIAGIIRSYRKEWVLGASLTAFGFAIQVACQHYQITYYLGFFLIFLAINELYKAVKSKTIINFTKSSSIILIACIIGIGPSIGRIWQTSEYNEISIRGKSELTQSEGEHQGNGLDRDYAFSWSQGKAETLTLLYPNMYGGASHMPLDKSSNTYEAMKDQGVPTNTIKQFVENVPLYWGDQPFTGGPVYAGIIIIVFAFLSFFNLKNTDKYWLIAASLFFMILAWGKNFDSINYFLFDHLPGYNKFRTPSMALCMTTMAITILGMRSLNQFLNSDTPVEVKTNFLKKATIGLIGVLVLVLIAVLTTSFSGPADQTLISNKYPQWLIDAIIDDRKAMLWSNFLKATLFVAISVSLLYLTIKKTIQSNYAILAIGILAIIDLWSVDKTYFNEDDFSKKSRKEAVIQMDAGDKEILQDKDISYRVLDLNNPFNNGTTSYFHKSIGGYHGAKIRRYQDIIEKHISQNNQKVLDMLNTRYIKTTDPKDRVVKRNSALGNAWYISTLKEVNSADEELAALTNLEPKNEAIVDVTKFSLKNTNYSANGNISLKEYQPNHMIYTSQSDETGFAVFSEIYYDKGWTAYIDGNKQEYVRVNYVLRGMEIPAGKHTIEFKFAPKSYTVGNTIALVTSILVYLSLGVGLVLAYRRKDNE